MKAPVGLLSGRAVCVSRWRGFAPTSSADAPLSHFHGRGHSGKLHLTFFLCEKGVQESPQTFLNPEIKKISSSEYAQSAAERIPNRPTQKERQRCRSFLLSHGRDCAILIPDETKVYLKTKKMTDISQAQAGFKANSRRNPLWISRLFNAKSRCVCRNRLNFRLFRYTQENEVSNP